MLLYWYNELTSTKKEVLYFEESFKPNSQNKQGVTEFSVVVMSDMGSTPNPVYDTKGPYRRSWTEKRAMFRNVRSNETLRASIIL